MNSGGSSPIVNRRAQRESNGDSSWSGSISSVRTGMNLRGGLPSCHCGLNATIYMSRIAKNPNKPFFGCPYYQEKKAHCKYFLWLEDYVVSSDLAGTRIKEIEMKMENNFAMTHKEIRCLKMGLRLLGIVMLFVIMLVLMK